MLRREQFDELLRVLASNKHVCVQAHAVAKNFGYIDGEPLETLAAGFDCPPCYLLRRLIEVQTAKNHLPGVSNRWLKPSKVMRCPGDMLIKMEDASPADVKFAHRWSADLAKFASIDPQHSAYGDVLRYTSGKQMEAVLYGKLRALQVPLWTEQQLRHMGYHKTPDVYLQVPIMLKGRLVHWIDSKAAFGSPKLHDQQMEQQYRKYIDRFGPGAVIYWFGYVLELQTEGPEDLLLLDSFPLPSEVLRLPSMACPPRPNAL
eukprot:jgi/Botrbrau1/23422/Bobra.0051s0065.2